MDVAHTHTDLHAQLEAAGWKLTRIKQKGTTFTAAGENQNGEKAERHGNSPEMALAQLLRFAVRHNEIRRFSAYRTSAWRSHWMGQHEHIADAYRKLPVFDAKAVPAWKALAQETKGQADAIRSQIHVIPVDENNAHELGVANPRQPYASADEMRDDVHRNRRYLVGTADTEHPVWSPEQVQDFRVVHDVLGYGQSGASYTWRGANQAAQHHLPLVSPLARQALFMEAVASPAHFKTYQHYGPHRIATLPAFLNPIQDAEGEQVHVPHSTMPLVPPPAAPGAMAGPVDPGQWIGQEPTHFVQTPGTFSRTAAAKGASVDPNRDWSPGLMSHDMQPPIPSLVQPDGTLHPSGPQDPPEHDYIERQHVEANAYNNIPKWQDPETHEMLPWWDERVPTSVQDEAILNAFKMAILSPQKHLKWNAAHYQAIAHMPAHTPAHQLYEHLDRARRAHNEALGHDPDGHLSYSDETKLLAKRLGFSEGMTDHEAMSEAKRRVHEMRVEAEQILLMEAVKHEVEADPLWVEVTVHRMVDHWLKGTKPDHPVQRIPYAKPRFDEDGKQVWKKERKRAPEEIKNPLQRLVKHPDAFPERPDYKVAPKHKPKRVVDDAPETMSLLSTWRTSAQQEMDFGWGVQPDHSDILPDASLYEGENPKGDARPTAKYGMFYSSHLNAIAGLGQHIDHLREAALQDIHHDGGRGFHFRNEVMNLGVAGANAKVASFVWLMLTPMTSDLGVLDTHMARVFGVPEAEIGKPKHYYKFERMQKTAKDVSGYADMPLGLYHWGLWDLARSPDPVSGKPLHSDHQSLRPLDPMDWRKVKWETSVMGAPTFIDPKGLANARPHMADVADEFERRFEGHPAGRAPEPGLPPNPGRGQRVQLGSAWVPVVGDRVLIKPDLVQNLGWKPKDPRWESDMQQYPEATIIEIMSSSRPDGYPLFRVKGEIAGAGQDGLLVRQEQIIPAQGYQTNDELPQVPDTLPEHWSAHMASEIDYYDQFKHGEDPDDHTGRLLEHMFMNHAEEGSEEALSHAASRMPLEDWKQFVHQKVIEPFNANARSADAWRDPSKTHDENHDAWMRARGLVRNPGYDAGQDAFGRPAIAPHGLMDSGTDPVQKYDEMTHRYDMRWFDPEPSDSPFGHPSGHAERWFSELGRSLTDPNQSAQRIDPTKVDWNWAYQEAIRNQGAEDRKRTHPRTLREHGQQPAPDALPEHWSNTSDPTDLAGAMEGWSRYMDEAKLQQEAVRQVTDEVAKKTGYPLTAMHYTDTELHFTDPHGRKHQYRWIGGKWVPATDQFADMPMHQGAYSQAAESKVRQKARSFKRHTEDQARELAKLALREDMTKADLEKALKGLELPAGFRDDALDAYSSEKRKKGLMGVAWRRVRGADERKPDHIFVFYKGELLIEDWHHNRRFKDMLAELLDKHNMDLDSIYSTGDLAEDDIAAGDVYEYADGALYVDQQQLARPEVQAQARQKVYDHLVTRRDLVPDAKSD